MKQTAYTRVCQSFVALLLVVCTNKGYAQEEKIDSLLTSNSKIAVENIYLHLDKNLCTTGDSIWFSAYILENNRQFSKISTNLYVQLFSDSNTNLPILKKIFPIVDGQSIGQLEIPDSLHTGTYWIMAYTRYQSNFDSTKFLTEPVAIYNPKENKVLVARQRVNSTQGPTISHIDSSFFWITSTSDSIIHCRFLCDNDSRLMNKRLHVVLTSYHQPIFKASFTPDGGKDKNISFPTRNLQGFVDLLLLDDTSLIQRQTILLTSPESSAFTVLMNQDSSGLGINTVTIHLNDASAVYHASISITDGAETEISKSNIFDCVSSDPVNYQHLLQGNAPTIRNKDASFLTWTGVVKRESGKPVRNAELIAMISQDSGAETSQQTRVIPIDSTGHFALNSFFFDTAMVSFQLNDHSGHESSKEIHLYLDSAGFLPLQPSAKKIWSDAKIIKNTTTYAGYTPIPPGAKVKVLPKVTVKARKDGRKELDDKYTTGMFSELTPLSYDVRTEKRAHTVWEFLRRELPGFGGGLDASEAPNLDGKTPVFYVNDEVKSLDELNMYWFTELAYIKVFKNLDVDLSRYEAWKTGQQDGFTLVGNKGGLKVPSQSNPPVICLYTRKGGDIRTGWAGLRHQTLAGYASIAKFSDCRDNRMTLYWEPLAQITSKREYNIKLRNSNSVQRFKVTIEGVTDTGAIFHYEQFVTPSDQGKDNYGAWLPHKAIAASAPR